MHYFRQRRSAALGVDAKALVRNVILLVVAEAVVRITVDNSEDAPAGALRAVAPAGH